MCRIVLEFKEAIFQFHQYLFIDEQYNILITLVRRKITIPI